MGPVNECSSVLTIRKTDIESQKVWTSRIQKDNKANSS